MELPLWLHILVHFIFSLLAGFIAWKTWKNKIFSFLGGIIGGVLVDFDHFIDYFLAFGLHFNFSYFAHGYQFLKSDKSFILFHGWEYVIILLALIFIILKDKVLKSLFLGLVLGLFFHLCADIIIDKVPPKIYSLTYRIIKNFELKSLVYPEHWEKHIIKKGDVRPENL